jgi:hypothetical protein
LRAEKSPGIIGYKKISYYEKNTEDKKFLRVLKNLKKRACSSRKRNAEFGVFGGCL